MARSRLAVSARRQVSAEIGLRTNNYHNNSNSSNSNGAAIARAVRQPGGRTCRWMKTNKKLKGGMGREVGGGSGCGTHVNPWLIHVNVWQRPLQYCKVISLPLIKINLKNAYQGKKKTVVHEVR